MKLEKIITLANPGVRLRFMAMERSLRAMGCDLPLWVIPYDESRFELPANATWWTTPLREWFREQDANPLTSKYQCLTTANYQYVDSDIIFLRDPAKVLAQEKGFITSCGHWHYTEPTVDLETVSILKSKSTCWQRNVFNCGQFACDRALYTEEELKRACQDPHMMKTYLHFDYNDQPGMVLLTNLIGVPIHNLTLPPTNMESTWAGDYLEDGYEDYWRDETRKPYLIHWAGCKSVPKAIDSLFTQYLTAAELKEWTVEVTEKRLRKSKSKQSLRNRFRNVALGMKVAIGKVRP